MNLGIQILKEKKEAKANACFGKLLKLIVQFVTSADVSRGWGGGGGGLKKHCVFCM
jgi:hypothetical protein